MGNAAGVLTFCRVSALPIGFFLLPELVIQIWQYCRATLTFFTQFELNPRFRSRISPSTKHPGDFFGVPKSLIYPSSRNMFITSMAHVIHPEDEMHYEKLLACVAWFFKSQTLVV